MQGMKITARTKVSEVIKTSSQAIDALISVSTKFSKLKNPLLRKIMAPRVTLEQAAKIGGVRVDEIFIALQPLGFNVDVHTKNDDGEYESKTPAFVDSINDSNVLVIDVRPIIASGKDPLNHILDAIKKVKEGQIFSIVNTFEPIPLISLLEKKGFESYVKYIDTEEVHTYFSKNTSQVTSVKEESVNSPEENFEEMLKKYEGNITETDVRDLEMPLPMLTILDLLESLPQKNILYVHHKRTPLYLLPELEEKGFEYYINEISEGNVKLIIRHKV